MRITNDKEPDKDKTGVFTDASDKSLGWVLIQLLLIWTVFPLISSCLTVKSYIEKKPMQIRDDEP